MKPAKSSGDSAGSALAKGDASSPHREWTGPFSRHHSDLVYSILAENGFGLRLLLEQDDKDSPAHRPRCNDDADELVVCAAVDHNCASVLQLVLHEVDQCLIALARLAIKIDAQLPGPASIDDVGTVFAFGRPVSLPGHWLEDVLAHGGGLAGGLGVADLEHDDEVHVYLREEVVSHVAPGRSDKRRHHHSDLGGVVEDIPPRTCPGFPRSPRLSCG